MLHSNQRHCQRDNYYFNLENVGSLDGLHCTLYVMLGNGVTVVILVIILIILRCTLYAILNNRVTVVLHVMQ